MPNKSRLDWVEKAFQLLIEHGVSAISANKVGNSLGLSRGSFYYHFGSSKGFHQAILETWYQRGTVDVLKLNIGKSPQQKLEGLRNFAWLLPHKLDVAIRSWALYDPLAKGYQEKVDADRLNYVTQVYKEALGNKLSEDKLKFTAKLAYYAFIGTQNIQPSLSDAELDEFKQGLHDILAKAFNLK